MTGQRRFPGGYHSILMDQNENSSRWSAFSTTRILSIFLLLSYVWHFARTHSTGRKQNTFFLGRTHGSLAPTGFYRPVSTFSPSAFKLPHTCVYVYHVYHIRARADATLDYAQYRVHCWRLDIFVSYEMQWFLPQSGLWGWPIVNCVHQVTRQVSTDSRAALDSNL